MMSKRMRVLVACEYSGVVRDAFLRRGHDAVSCDILPTESDLGPHIKGDVLPLLEEPWDLVIAHPPCTYLCQSAVQYLYREPERWMQLADAATFFLHCWHANSPRVAVENPTMHRYARDLVGIRPTFCVQPFWFGDFASKRTCFWVRGLPTLIPTQPLYDPDGKKAPPWTATTRTSKKRSLTFKAIAAAMADQWGDFTMQQVHEHARHTDPHRLPA